MSPVLSLMLLLTFINFVITSNIQSSCPELRSCLCEKNKARAKCHNIMHIPRFPAGTEIVDLSHNAIIELQGSDFDQNTAITDLDLRNNNIRQISKNAFEHLSELTSINLSNNKLRTLDKDVFEKNVKLKYLYLDNNSDLSFLLSGLPVNIEYISLLNTNSAITSDVMQSYSKLTRYDGKLCLKKYCSQHVELYAEIYDNQDSSYIERKSDKINYESVLRNQQLKSEVDNKIEWNITFLICLVAGLAMQLLVVALVCGIRRTMYKEPSNTHHSELSSPSKPLLEKETNNQQ